MTIIAYRDGVMAADTATWQGGVMIGDRSKKIMRTPEGFLIACAGELSVISEFRAVTVPFAVSGANFPLRVG